MKKSKIIIFSVSFGNGHNQVSKVLLKYLKSHHYDVEIIDTFDAINKLFHKIILESYLKLLRYRPSLWGKLYQYSEENPNSIFLKQFNSFLINKLQKLLEQKSPNIILTTHPIATTLVASIIRRRRLPIRLYALLTDFAVHPMSVHQEVNGYFIASEHLRFYAKMYNLPEEIFYPTGIPTFRENLNEYSKREWRQKLQLHEEMKTVLIAGGGVGLAKFTNILAGLETFNEKLQIICVTGENKRAKQNLMKLKSKHDLRILGFTTLFMEYLKASDVILTKAGGVTTSEALICGTPILIFQPLPGQEEQNSQFLMNYGAAIKAEIVDEIPILLERIIFNEHYHRMMVQNSAKLKSPNAPLQITKIISNDCQKQERKLIETYNNACTCGLDFQK